MEKTATRHYNSLMLATEGACEQTRVSGRGMARGMPAEETDPDDFSLTFM